jgi:hypothetical protein
MRFSHGNHAMLFLHPRTWSEPGGFHVPEMGTLNMDFSEAISKRNMGEDGDREHA